MTDTETIRDIFCGEAERLGMDSIAVFDRWLADHDRQVKADALRTLADPDTLQLRDGVGSPWMVAEWINAEADRIEDIDPEEFCDLCLAGVTSDEHYGKCQATDV